jgi:hypothetical protein
MRILTIATGFAMTILAMPFVVLVYYVLWNW